MNSPFVWLLASCSADITNAVPLPAGFSAPLITSDLTQLLPSVSVRRMHLPDFRQYAAAPSRARRNLRRTTPISLEKLAICRWHRGCGALAT